MNHERIQPNDDHAQQDDDHAQPDGRQAAPDHDRARPDDEHTPAPAPAPITVGRPAGTGGRRVTIRGRSAGIAHSDADVVEFLRRAGLPDAWDYLDDPQWVDWQDGGPRTYDTTPPGHGDHGEVIG